jgi:hypothetical protein
MVPALAEADAAQQRVDVALAGPLARDEQRERDVLVATPIRRVSRWWPST